MNHMNWMQEVLKRKEDFMKDLKGLLQIKSVLDEENKTEETPLGPEVKKALEYMLDLGQKDGFTVKNVDHLAGHVEMGQGDELLGILGHVDVVPEGDGWDMDPYAAEVKNGNVYARGASDDKGPTIAGYYAMKIVKELGLPLNKRVRLIIGTDEESDWRCVERYFEKEEMPSMGFVPDADFPIIYAEKGIMDFDIIQPIESYSTEGAAELLSFQSGRRYNMVPDLAEARVRLETGYARLEREFETYLTEAKLEGDFKRDGSELTIRVIGKSAHGAEPRLGKNAGNYLARFLQRMRLDEAGKKFLGTIGYFFNQYRGEVFNLYYEDESGDMSMNVGIMEYDQKSGGRIGINMRYPVTYAIQEGIETIQNSLQNNGLTFECISHSKPTYVQKEDPLIQSLQKVYEEQTGESAELLAIGGGTYARALDHGVAFGALFPGREDVMHQKNEYAVVDDLLKATAIYAQAIYELAK